MQETWEFDFNSSVNLPVEEALEALVEKESKEVGIYLSYYYRPEGGLVEQVSLQEGVDFESPTAGTLKVCFYVVYYTACLNIHSEDNKDEMTLHSEIAPERQKVKFTCPYWPQGEPDGL